MRKRDRVKVGTERELENILLAQRVQATRPKGRLKLVRAADGWRWRIRQGGKIVEASSEAFVTAYNAERSAWQRLLRRCEISKFRRRR